MSPQLRPSTSSRREKRAKAGRSFLEREAGVMERLRLSKRSVPTGTSQRNSQSGKRSVRRSISRALRRLPRRSTRRGSRSSRSPQSLRTVRSRRSSSRLFRGTAQPPMSVRVEEKARVRMSAQSSSESSRADAPLYSQPSTFFPICAPPFSFFAYFSLFSALLQLPPRGTLPRGGSVV